MMVKYIIIELWAFNGGKSHQISGILLPNTKSNELSKPTVI